MRLILGFIFFLSFLSGYGQVFSNKEMGKKNESRIDSIKNSEYPYVLPILGKKAAKAGFDLPYSAGISAQYLWQKSDLIIDNLQIGFNNAPMTNLDEVIRFEEVTSEASGYNIRPDIWILPFLNIYGILAASSPTTSVYFGIYLPDENGNRENVASFKTKAEFQAVTSGFGITPTIGVGGGWMAFDMNFTWSDIAELEEPAFAFVFGPRFGKSFKLGKPERSISLWAGGFRLSLNTGTSGSLKLNDLFDLSEIEQKVDNGIAAVEQRQESVNTWWNGLTAPEQKNPVNIAKYESANRALDKAGTFFGNLDESLENTEESTVQYSLDKRQKQMWNFIVGSQFQYNKHWMIRLEVGMLASRTQIIGGLQYRFGL